jgi:hypothetical protein
MRATPAAVLIGLLLSTPASAAGPTPKIRSGTPYNFARSQLIAQGFDPVRIVGRDGNPCKTANVCNPELEDCASPGVCSWIYRRRSDGTLFQVVTEREGLPGDHANGGPVAWVGPLRRIVDGRITSTRYNSDRSH